MRGNTSRLKSSRKCFEAEFYQRHQKLTKWMRRKESKKGVLASRNIGDHKKTTLKMLRVRFRNRYDINTILPIVIRLQLVHTTWNSGSFSSVYSHKQEKFTNYISVLSHVFYNPRILYASCSRTLHHLVISQLNMAILRQVNCHIAFCMFS